MLYYTGTSLLRLQLTKGNNAAIFHFRAQSTIVLAQAVAYTVSSTSINTHVAAQEAEFLPYNGCRLNGSNVVWN